MIKSTKKALYATVGAPVLTAKRVNEKFQDITARLRDTDLTAEFEAWAAEGEKLIDRFGDQPMIEELSSRLDDMEMPAQVGKLREQLDDMVANWRKNFRPADVSVKVDETAKAPAAKTEPAKKAPAAKKPAAKATTAKKPAAKKATTAKATTKPAAAKKPAAKKATTAKATAKPAAAKKPAAKKATAKSTQKA